jgi:O-antigen ligase
MGLDLIGHYPFGVGFQVIRGLYGYPAHNQFILWGLGTGIGGFAAVMGLMLVWLIRMVKALRKRYEPALAMSLGALAAVVGGLISINGDNISTSVGWTQSTLWIFLGIGAAAFTVVRALPKAEMKEELAW